MLFREDINLTSFIFITSIIFLFMALIFLIKKNKAIFNLIKTIVLIIIITILVFFIILFPEEIINASKKGIRVWFDSVLPSLLPFFIGAELLIGLGVVKFIGVLIEPIIRPVFKVPGETSFIFAMSITSGYPMGAKLVADLRNKGVLNRIEAQRVMAFCSTSGPLFMIGAVSIGMFHNQSIGPFIALAHYLGALTVGLIFRFYKNDNVSCYKSSFAQNNIIKKAFNEMLKAKKNDGRSFGQLLSDSVRESISTIVLVGGFIVLFSVIIEELSLLGVFNFVYIFISRITDFSFVNKDLIKIVMTGFVEITIGCKTASESISISPMLQVILSTMIISWSGLSIHAQVISLINNTDIKINIYVISKILHSAFSGIYIFIILRLGNYTFLNISKEVFSQSITRVMNYTWLNKFMFSSKLFISMISILFLIGVIFNNIKYKVH